MASATQGLAAVQAAATISTAASTGTGAVGINITGTFVATILFEATTDGSNWFATAAYPLLAAGMYGAPVNSTTAIGTFAIPVYGYTQVRARVSSYTSGTATVISDMATSAPLGQIYANTEGTKATYSFSVNALAPQATPTDLLVITGSATKTVKVTRIRLQFRATAGTQYRASLIKYSVAGTGGTAASLTAIPHDSADAAATATVQTFAGGANTPGTALGKIADESLPVAVLGTPAAGLFPIFYDWAGRPSRAITLRGVAQQLAVNCAGVALPSGFVFDAQVELTEE